MRAQFNTVSPFTHQLAGFEKRGPPLLVEQYVSTIVSDLGNMEEHFKQSASDIKEAVPGKGLGLELKRARLNREVAEGVAAYGVAQIAMPIMTKWHQAHGDFIIPESTEFDFYHDYPFMPKEPDSVLRTRALRLGYWFGEAARVFLGESKADTKHPYHRLHRRLAETWPGYVSTFKAHELARYGENDSKNAIWQSEDYTYDRIIVGDHLTAVGVSLDLLAAAAIHAIIYDDIREPSELAPLALTRLEQIQWIASAHRESDKHKAKKAALELNITPNGSLNVLAKQLDLAKSIDEFVQAFLSYRVVADREFCPAEEIRHGPPSVPGLCAGELNVDIPTLDERRCLAGYYETVGLVGISTTKLNATTVVLGSVKRQSEVVTFPAIEAFLEKYLQ